MPNGLKVVICFLIYLRVVGPNLTLELSGACLTVNPLRTGFILVGDSQIKSIHSPPIFLPLQKNMKGHFIKKVGLPEFKF